MFLVNQWDQGISNRVVLELERCLQRASTVAVSRMKRFTNGSWLTVQFFQVSVLKRKQKEDIDRMREI